jgi:hypothetical protein
MLHRPQHRGDGGQMHHTSHLGPTHCVGDHLRVGQLAHHAADRRVWMQSAVNHGDRVAPAGEGGNGRTTDEAGAPGDHDPAGAGW